jgi:glycosyltransferase involved in cell wall biosynthesis
VIHATDAYFAFARTAERVARRRGVPLVSSIHTDTPSYTNVYTAETIRRLFGQGWLSRWLIDRAGLPRRAEARMRRRLLRHQRQCRAVLAARPDERERLQGTLAPDRVGLLRRGMDHDLFAPAKRDRSWLEKTFDLPAGRVVVLFVGRLSSGKNVMTLVDAVAALNQGGGRRLQLLCAGEGPQRPLITARLGAAARCPGVLSPEDLARAYASVDIVAHPSEIEECSNVVLEALASGAALAAAGGDGSGRLVGDRETGILVSGSTVVAWADALCTLADGPELRQRLGAAARAWAVRGIPSWRQVLTEDLLPVWTRVRADGGARG